MQKVQIKQDSYSRSFDCPMPGCGRTFETDHGLRIHIGKMHKEPDSESDSDTYDCPFCDCPRSFETERGLKIHIGKMHK